MSVRDALAFIRAVREAPQLLSRLESLGAAASLDDVVQLAAGAGFTMSADDLRAAHRHDWGLRLARSAISSTDKAGVVAARDEMIAKLLSLPVPSAIEMRDTTEIPERDGLWSETEL